MAAYTPVTKAKANDLSALSLLSATAKQNIKPLIEPPVTRGESGFTTDLSAATTSLRLKAGDLPFYFDPLDFEIPSRQAAAFEELSDSNCAFTPVVGLGRRALDTHVIGSLVAKHRRGLCLRLQRDDLEDASEETWVRLAQLASETQVSSTDLDLLFDFGQIAHFQISSLRNMVLDFLRAQPRFFKIRNIGILASSCLSSVTNIDLDGKQAIERRELELWASLIYELDGTRSVSFGDYGILSPQFVLSGPNPNSNAKIRYTRGSRTTYFRGHGLYNPNRFDQYHALAQRVVDSGLFLGAPYSFGDDVIQRCADRASGPGNLGTWVRADTNHHLEFTAQQVPRLLGELLQVSNEQQVRDVVLQDS
jgi:hypothetical protein